MRSLLVRWRNIIALRRLRNSYCAIRERVIVSSRQVNSRVNSRTKGGLSHLAFVRHLVGHCRNLECQRQLRCLSQYVIWRLGGAMFLEPISLTNYSFASKSDLISASLISFHGANISMKWLFPELVILMTSIIFSGSSDVIIELMAAAGVYRPRVLCPGSLSEDCAHSRVRDFISKPMKC